MEPSRVRETHLPPQSDTDRQLLNGTIEHGAEWFAPQFLDQPLTYYAPNSGLGLPCGCVVGTGPKRVGVIGLGTGTVAAYGNAGDVIRFYEINPLVERLARLWFTFLHDSAARTDVVLGDARLSLAAEASAALQRDRDRCLFRGCHPGAFVDPGGAGALSPAFAAGWHSRLPRFQPVRRSGARSSPRIANDAGLNAVSVHSHGDEQNGLYYANWILVTTNQAFLTQPEVVNNAFPTPLKPADTRLWTDDYSSRLSTAQMAKPIVSLRGTAAPKG